MSSIQDVFAANLRKYRKAAHLSQEKLAELARLHRTYIGGIEQKRVNVSLKNIGKIASALDVDPALLFISGDTLAVRPRTEYALVSWHDDQVSIRPIEVSHEDLTIQILCQLAKSGLRGDELAARYQEVHAEISQFLSGQRNPNDAPGGASAS